MFEYISKLYFEVGKHEILSERPNLITMARRNTTSRVLKQLLAEEGIKNILEVGPGSGYVTEEICEALKNSVCKLSVLDISDSFLKRVTGLNLNIADYILADIQAPELEVNSKYDMIIMQEVLEHTSCPFYAINNLNKLLIQGGVAFVSIPNTFRFRYILSFYKNVIIKGKKAFPDTHIAELSPWGFVKLATMCGFAIEKVLSYPSLCERFLGLITGAEIGFLIRKIDEPEKVWVDYTQTLLKNWN